MRAALISCCLLGVLCTRRVMPGCQNARPRAFVSAPAASGDGSLSGIFERCAPHARPHPPRPAAQAVFPAACLTAAELSLRQATRQAIFSRSRCARPPALRQAHCAPPTSPCAPSTVPTPGRRLRAVRPPRNTTLQKFEYVRRLLAPARRHAPGPANPLFVLSEACGAPRLRAAVPGVRRTFCKPQLPGTAPRHTAHALSRSAKAPRYSPRCLRASRPARRAAAPLLDLALFRPGSRFGSLPPRNVPVPQAAWRRHPRHRLPRPRRLHPAVCSVFDAVPVFYASAPQLLVPPAAHTACADWWR